MRQPTKRAFILSSVGHGALLLGIAVTSLLSNCSKDEPVVHVFELLPSPAPAVTPEPIRTVRPKPVPSPPPAPVVSKPKPPEPKVEKPKPPEPKVEKPKPPPPIKEPKKIVPRPAPKKPEPPLEKTTLRKWREKNPTTKPKPVTRPEKVKVKPLNVDSFKVEVEAPKIPNRPSLNANEMKLQDIYLARVGQLIEAHWMNLKKGSNLRGPANATMQFRIRGNGSLWSLKLIEASASPEFNRVVHTAFRSVENLGRPPSPIEYPLTMTFRLN